MTTGHNLPRKMMLGWVLVRVRNSVPIRTSLECCSGRSRRLLLGFHVRECRTPKKDPWRARRAEGLRRGRQCL